MPSILITLTPRQKEIAEWAIDPMSDYFEEQFESGEMIYMPEMPFIERDTDHLNIPEDAEVIGDLLYRLLNLFQDICDAEQRGFVATHIVNVDGTMRRNTEGEKKRQEEAAKAKSDALSARGLARKIRSAAKRHHIKPVEYV
jgi:hypothetical protein